jgi:hypothetical protein
MGARVKPAHDERGGRPQVSGNNVTSREAAWVRVSPQILCGYGASG